VLAAAFVVLIAAQWFVCVKRMLALRKLDTLVPPRGLPLVWSRPAQRPPRRD
jgi:hypothetical protein